MNQITYNFSRPLKLHCKWSLYHFWTRKPVGMKNMTLFNTRYFGHTTVKPL